MDADMLTSTGINCAQATYYIVCTITAVVNLQHLRSAGHVVSLQYIIHTTHTKNKRNEQMTMM